MKILYACLITVFFIIAINFNKGYCQVIDTKVAEAKTDTVQSLPVEFSLPRAKEYRTWEAGIHFGICFPTTDIAASDINASYAKENYAVGLQVTKFFSHTLGAKVEYIYGKISGQNRKSTASAPYDIAAQYGYVTTIKSDLTINAIAHLGNIRFLSRTPNIGVYATAGVGLIYFNPVNDSLGSDGIVYTSKWNYHASGNPAQAPNVADYHNSVEYVVPFGVGVRWLASDRITIDLGYTLRTTRSDKLDGFWRMLSEDDNYTYANIGVTYHFGKQKKIIEWSNPVQDVVDHFALLYNNLKLTVDSFKVDKDGDRVSDYWDRDPNTPAGYKVYGDGTAVDFDGDGVPDAIDYCPTIPGPASNHGCPEVVVSKVEPKKEAEVIKPTLPTEEQEIISQVFKNLQFETAKSVIRESSYQSLNELATLLKRKATYKLKIEGHTDNVGGAASNMKLSNDRANSVKKYLMDKGIEESRLIAIGYGLTRPIADNKTPEGRQKNRRVDFTIVQ